MASQGLTNGMHIHIDNMCHTLGIYRGMYVCTAAQKKTIKLLLRQEARKEQERGNKMHNWKKVLTKRHGEKH